MYTQPIGNIIRKHQMLFHMYADDTQLYKSLCLSNLSLLVHCTENCIDEVRNWMSVNKLKMNDDKTEVLSCSTKSKLTHLIIDHLNIGDEKVEFSNTVKNLGVVFDRDLSMSSHVNNMCKLSYLELRRLSQIRPFLSNKATMTLASAFILSRLDYCNSILFGVTKAKLSRLQQIQNNAARLVFKKPKKQHVTPLLKKLHWLPVTDRIEYKIASLCFKSLNRNGPSYMSDILSYSTPIRELRSSSKQLLSVLRPKLKTYGERAFTFAGPTIWNSIPISVKNSENFEIFKKKLKTYLFTRHFHS